MPSSFHNPRTLLDLEHLEDRLAPAVFSFAGFAFEQDSTPDVRTLLSPGTFNGAIVTALPTAATGSITGFPDPGAGFNNGLTLGTILNNTGTARALNLPSGNNGVTARSGLDLSWSGGRGLINLAGNDLVFYESGTISGVSQAPEAFMIQVHNATTNTWSDWYYEPADAAAPYGGVGTQGAFATAIDLTNLGLATGDIIDRIRLVNMTDEDRMVNASGVGEVIPEDNGATSSNFPAPGPLAPFANYGSSDLDPDPIYVGAFTALTSTLVNVAVTKTNNQTEVPVGGILTYTLTVSNAGTSAANGVSLTDVLPAGLTNVAFTSQANGGATGNTNGAGNLNELLNLPVGASVVYTVTAKLSVPASTTLTNTANVAAAITNTDSDLSNNSATDTDTVLFHPAFVVTLTPDLYTPRPVPDANTAFVQGLYHQVLGRDGDATGIANWVQALNTGTTIEVVINGFLNSLERREQQVESYYQKFLGRTAATDPGSDTWVNLLLTNQNEVEVIASILASNEYATLQSTNAQFAASLYLELLGRPADGGVANWEAKINGGTSRQDVVREFLNSTEANLLATETLYVAFFQRAGDPSQVNWITRLQAGGFTLTDLARNFLVSTENLQRATSNVF